MDEEFKDLDSMLNEADNMDMDLSTGDPDKPSTGILGDAQTAIEMTDVMDIAKSAKKSIYKNLPNNLGDSLESAENIVSTSIETFEEGITDVRKNASKLVGGIASLLPESMATPLNRIKSWLYEDEDTGSSNELSEDEKIQNEVGSLFEQLNRSNMEQQLQAKQQEFSALQQTELLAKIAANTEKLVMSKIEFDSVISKKSLELKYKQTYTLIKMYDVIKKYSEINTKQLEAIVKNTGLPDFAKTRTSDFVKQELLERGKDVGYNIFKSTNIFKSAEEKLKNIVETKLQNISGVLGDQAGMVDMVSGMMNPEMGLTPTAMLMSMGIGAGIDKMTDVSAKKLIAMLSKNEDGFEGMKKLDMLTSDANKGLKEVANKYKKKDEVTGELIDTKFSKAIEFIADLFDKDNSKASIEISSTKDLNESTFLDGKMKKSITTVIPGLLSKILAEVTTIRKGRKEIDDKDIVSFDFKNNKFRSRKDYKEEYEKDIKEDGEKLIKSLTDENLIKQILGPVDNISKRMQKEFAFALFEYLTDGKSTSPYYMIKDGFLDYIQDRNLRRLAETNLMSLANPKDEKDFEKIKNLQSELENIRERDFSNFKKVVDKAQLTGDTEILEQLGLLDSNQHNEVTGDKTLALNKKMLDDHFRSSSSILGFSEGGYTGDGPKEVVAGIVHAGEYVINKEKVKDLVDSVSETKIEDVVKHAGDIVNDIKDKSKEHYNKLKSFSKDKLEAGLKYVPDSVKETVGDNYKKAKDFVSEKYKDFKETDIGKTLDSVVSTVKDEISDLDKTIKNKFKSVKKEVADKITSWGIEIPKTFGDIPKTFTSTFTAIKNAIPKNFKDVKDDINLLSKTLKSSIKAVIEHIPEPIKNVTKSIEESIGKVTNKITGSLENMYGNIKGSLTEANQERLTALENKFKDIKTNVSTVIGKTADRLVSYTEDINNLQEDAEKLYNVTRDQIVKAYEATKETGRDYKEAFKEKGISGGLKHVVQDIGSKSARLYGKLHNKLTNIPDVSADVMMSMRTLDEILNNEGLEKLIRIGMSQLEFPESYSDAVATYKALLLSIDPSGNLWRRTTESKDGIEELQKLHMKVIDDEQKGLLGKTLDFLDDSIDEGKNLTGKLRDKLINALPKPLQPLAKKALDNRFTKFLGRQVGRVKDIAKSSGKLFLDEMRIIGSEGKELFFDPETGKFRLPKATDLAKFGIKSYTRSMKATGEAAREFYTGMLGKVEYQGKGILGRLNYKNYKAQGGILTDTIGEATKGAWDLLGVGKTARQLKNRTLAKIKPPIPRDLYNLWTSGKMNAGQVMEALETEEEKAKWEAWLLENTGGGLTIADVLKTTGSWYVSSMLGTGKATRKGYTTLGKATKSVSKTLFKAAWTFSGLPDIFNSTKEKVKTKVKRLLDYISDSIYELVINDMEPLAEDYGITNDELKVLTQDPDKLPKKEAEFLKDRLIKVNDSYTVYAVKKDEKARHKGIEYIYEIFSLLKGEKVDENEVKKEVPKVKDKSDIKVNGKEITKDDEESVKEEAKSFFEFIKDAVAETFDLEVKKDIEDKQKEKDDKKDSEKNKEDNELISKSSKKVVNDVKQEDKENKQEQLLEKMNENEEQIKQVLEKVVEQNKDHPTVKKIVDNDGDGIRDGSYIDRMKKLYSKKKDDDQDDKKDNKIVTAIKGLGRTFKSIFSSKSLWLTAIALFMNKMGITGKDVAEFITGVKNGVSKLIDIIKSIYDFLKPIVTKLVDWTIKGFDFLKKGVNKLIDGFKYVGHKIASAFRYIKTLPQRISYYIKDGLSHIYGLGGLKPDPNELKKLDEYVENGDNVKDDKPVPDTNNDDNNAETTNKKAVTTGEIAAYAATAYVAKKTGVLKAGKATVKATYNTAKFVANKTGIIKPTEDVPESKSKVVNEVKDKVKSKTKDIAKKVTDKTKKVKPPKGLISRIKSFLKIMKKRVIKKLGVKAGAKLAAKIAARFVPFAGWAMLAYDAYHVAKYMLVDKMSFKSAVSKAILGFDIFDDSQPAIDPDTGEPIKPDEPPVKVDKSKDETKTLTSNKHDDQPDITSRRNPHNPHITHVTSEHVTNFNPRAHRYHHEENVLDKLKEAEKVKIKPAKKIDAKDIEKEITVKANIDLPRLLSDLTRDEGLVKYKYKDSLGYWTIGVGHLLDKRKGGIPLHKILGTDKDSITTNEAYKVLAYDVNRTLKALLSKLPWLKSFPSRVQELVTNLAFNMGIGTLLKFKGTLKELKNGNYFGVAEHLVKSKWYKQVGDRAKRIVHEFLQLANEYGQNANTIYSSNDTRTTKPTSYAKVTGYDIQSGEITDKQLKTLKALPLIGQPLVQVAEKNRKAVEERNKVKLEDDNNYILGNNKKEKNIKITKSTNKDIKKEQTKPKVDPKIKAEQDRLNKLRIRIQQALNYEQNKISNLEAKLSTIDANTSLPEKLRERYKTNYKNQIEAHKHKYEKYKGYLTKIDDKLKSLGVDKQEPIANLERDKQIVAKTNMLIQARKQQNNSNIKAPVSGKNVGTDNRPLAVNRPLQQPQPQVHIHNDNSPIKEIVKVQDHGNKLLDTSVKVQQGIYNKIDELVQTNRELAKVMQKNLSHTQHQVHSNHKAPHVEEVPKPVVSTSTQHF